MTGAFATARAAGNGSAGAGRPAAGVVEWLRVGERERAERVLGALERLGVGHLRTGVSWADWLRPEAAAWYDWLLPRLAERVEVLPCLAWTPPALGIVPGAASPPRDPKGLADFVDVVVSRYGEHFTHLELWDEPDRVCRWDRRLDPRWDRYCEMMGMAGHWASRCGKTAVLGATSRPDAAFLDMLARRGVLAQFGVVGVHGSPGRHPSSWHGWEAEVGCVRAALEAAGSGAEVWVTAASCPAGAGGERAQARALLEAWAAPVGRAYWATLEDLDPEMPGDEGFHADEREYQAGLYRADGRPKLAARLLEGGGRARLRRHVAVPRERRRTGGAGRRATLITGGAGFIGTNLAEHLASRGRRVIVYDSLARPGVECNAAMLAERFGDLVDVRVQDVRDAHALRRSVAEADAVFHFAAQVAVTTSLEDPTHDSAVNIGGTVALLEAVRRLPEPVPVVFTSTNKVYGHLGGIELRRAGERYEPVDDGLRGHGVGEDRALEFCSPYGCSKGAADQYVLDASRSYRVPGVVLRMSCIYGPHQCGNEDQGWVAHFVRRAIEGRPVTVYGDGRQVRDLLFVSDLVGALVAASERAAELAGRAFNMGGGAANAVSIREVLAMLGELTGAPVGTDHGPWRTGDQRWYVSDTRSFSRSTGWAAGVPAREGIARLHRWMAGAEGPGRGERPPSSPARPALSGTIGAATA